MYLQKTKFSKINIKNLGYCGNFSIITAFLLPCFIAIAGLTIDFTRISYNKVVLNTSSDASLETGLNALIHNDNYNSENIHQFIQNDFKTRLISNNFNAKDAETIANKAQITIEKTSNSYRAELISSYDMPLNIFSLIYISREPTINLKIESTITRKLTKNDTIIILANPQAWKLHENETSNSNNQEQWEKRNTLVVNSLNTLAQQKHILFAVINGNITDSGKGNIRNSFYKVYNQLNFPYYIGLGSREYQENIGNCMSFDTLQTSSKNGCAFDAINDISWTLENTYYSTLFNFRKDVIREKNITPWYRPNEHIIQGSLNYSWDTNDIHFIQMQNHPFFKEQFDDETFFPQFSVSIYASITDTGPSSWLKNDLKTAAQNNKKVFLTMYDAYSSNIINNVSYQQKQYMRELIQQYKIKAIFAGSSNKVEEGYASYIYNNARIYNAGLAYKGDYLVLERINDNTLSVTAYNGASGNPVVVKKMSDINLQ
ncbi:hypothetical protein [Liberibacter crescens]|nr:hypothetical protein [Liberibacter crescens]